MTEFIHKSLASGRWQKLTFPEQMANIGSEVGRAIQWGKKTIQSLEKKQYIEL
jgi:hypothetical protein